MYVWRQKWLSHDIQNLPKLIMVELAWFSEVSEVSDCATPEGLGKQAINRAC